MRQKLPLYLTWHLESTHGVRTDVLTCAGGRLDGTYMVLVVPYFRNSENTPRTVSYMDGLTPISTWTELYPTDTIPPEIQEIVLHTIMTHTNHYH
jgi:hypothetical protein